MTDDDHDDGWWTFPVFLCGGLVAGFLAWLAADTILSVVVP